jgi:hypothetical protein
MIFNEEFSKAGLNTSLWTPGWQHGGISGPVSGQCMSSSNVSQPGNGYLYLELKPQANTCEWGGERASVADTGALVESNPGDGVPGHTGFSYSYGFVEWRAYVPGIAPEGWGCPKGGCVPDWPALWSLPESHETEIDTMEGLGHLGQACYHFHPPFGSAGPGGCASGSYAGWHTYGVNWEPGVVTYYYDGSEVGKITSSKINSTPQYLVMNMVPPTDGQPLQAPDTMVIDYVRVWQYSAPDTPGAYEPSNNTFYLDDSDNPEVNIVVPHYGIEGDIPLVGDWTGDGADTPGAYEPSNNTFYLDDSDHPEVNIVVPNYGIKGDIPLVGDWSWDGVGIDTIGVYRPSNNTFYLSDTDTTKNSIVVPGYGIEGDIPLVGDWAGDGVDTPGVYRPSNNTFYLSDSDSTEVTTIVPHYGIAGDIPVVGDWTGGGYDTIGVYRPSNHTFYLSNSDNTEVNIIVPNYGIEGDIPLVGDWTGIP